MILHTEQNCNNAIDLVDELGDIVGSVEGAHEGDDPVGPSETYIAELICRAFNEHPDSESI